jgi:hypothetical protein
MTQSKNGALAEARAMITHGRRTFDGREVGVLAGAAAEIGDAPANETDKRILEIAAAQKWYPPIQDPLPPFSAETLKKHAEIAAPVPALEKQWRQKKDAWLLAYEAALTAGAKSRTTPERRAQLTNLLRDAERDMQDAENLYTRAKARLNDYTRAMKQWQFDERHRLDVVARAAAAGANATDEQLQILKAAGAK